MRVSKKAIIKIVIEGIFLKQMQNIRKNIEDEEKYVVHVGTLKQALNHGLILKKVHRVIQFNQKA